MTLPAARRDGPLRRPELVAPRTRRRIERLRGYAESMFKSEGTARRVIPGLALHTDVGPDDPFGAAVVGFMLAMLASERRIPACPRADRAPSPARSSSASKKQEASCEHDRA